MRRTLISLALSLCAFSSAFAEVIPAKLISQHNKEPRLVRSPSGYMDGWTLLNYVIDEKGETKDLVILDSSGVSRFEHHAKDRVTHYKFEPATIDGKPVVSHKYYLMRNEFLGDGDSVSGITPGFAADYDRVTAALGENDLETASKALNELQEHTRNLYEHAWNAWVHSMFYFQQQDFQRYRREMRVAVMLRDKLATKARSRALTNLFEIELHFGDVMNADHTLGLMAKTEGVNLSAQTRGVFEQKVEHARSVSEHEASGWIAENGVWRHGLHAKVFSLADVKGQVDYLEVRCTGFHASLDAKTTQSISIPSKAQDCLLLVTGQPDSRFKVVYNPV